MWCRRRQCRCRRRRRAVVNVLVAAAIAVTAVAFDAVADVAGISVNALDLTFVPCRRLRRHRQPCQLRGACCSCCRR